MSARRARRGARGARARPSRADRLARDPERLEAYGRDESDLGDFPPDVVGAAWRAPRRSSAVFRVAARHRVPVMPVAARSGKSGGVLALEGGIARVARADEPDPRDLAEDLVARVEPGVITGPLQAEVEEHGLFYPPDPNSLELCTHRRQRRRERGRAARAQVRRHARVRARPRPWCCPPARSCGSAGAASRASRATT